MGRIQRGRIYERSGAFYVQYRVTEIINGEPSRVQRSHRLCDKSDKYYSKNSKAVKLLCSELMLKINSQQASGRTVQQDMRIADFWDQCFLPYCEEVMQVGERVGQPRMKASTIRGFQQIWRQHLKPHFSNVTLQEYEPRLGNQFLRGLTSTQNKNTLKHIKALATAVFSYAVEEENISLNPWREIKIPKDAVPPKPTAHYTLAEAQTLVSALLDHVDCQLILALSCFLGLRPGEIAALRWEDFDLDSGSVHIRRSVVRGVVSTPKTQESTAKIPLIVPVLIPLKLHYDKQGNPSEGYIFQSRNGKPVDLHNVVSRIIIPHVMGERRCVSCDCTPKSAGVTWKGLYSGRRGACTITIEATRGNYAVAQALLRHKSMKTTLDVYKKQITPEAFSEGMKLLEAKAAEVAAANRN
jgi:integrase